jgi:hypothetical protein
LFVEEVTPDILSTCAEKTGISLYNVLAGSN